MEERKKSATKSRKTTHDARRMTRDAPVGRPSCRRCFDCVFAYWDAALAARVGPMWWPVLPLCVNHPDRPGMIRPIPIGRPCRNFRARRRPAVWTSPPEPEEDGVRHIALTKGYYAVVDAADFEGLGRYKWTALVTGGKVYAIRNCKGKTILMHREIMGAPDDKVVDHIDGNGLNNQRQNLRLCTRRENLYNSRPRATRSQYKGVRFCKRRRKWLAEAVHCGHKFYLGAFDDEVEAARAYDRKAVELFGEFARLNFPQDCAV